MFERWKKTAKQSPKGLNIIIVGCGKVGATLTEQLCKEGHDIAVVDKSASRVQALTDLYDVMGWLEMEPATVFRWRPELRTPM